MSKRKIKKLFQNRKTIIIILAFVVIAGIGIYTFKGKIEADYFNSTCPIKQADKIGLILVNINRNGNGSLRALDERGNTSTFQKAVLGKFTYDKKNKQSAFNSFATPPGVYTIGKTWDSSKTPQLSSIKDKIGPYFIELQGKPFNGGVPVCGLSNPSCRHIGIHSSSSNLSVVGTKGCVKIDPQTVEYIMQNANQGTKVLIAENPLFGMVVQSKNGQKITEYTVKVKKSKKSVPVYHVKSSPYWIVQETNPTGVYTIEISAKGYKKTVLTQNVGNGTFGSRISTGSWWFESILGSQGDVIMLEKSK